MPLLEMLFTSPFFVPITEDIEVRGFIQSTFREFVLLLKESFDYRLGRKTMKGLLSCSRKFVEEKRNITSRSII